MISFPYSIIVGTIVGILNTIQAISLNKQQSSHEITTEKSIPNPNMSDNILFASLTISTTIYAVLLYILYTDTNSENNLVTGGMIDRIMIVLFILRGIGTYFILETYESHQDQSEYGQQQKRKGGVLGLAIAEAPSIFALIIGILYINGGGTEMNMLAYILLGTGLIMTIGIHMMKSKIFGIQTQNKSI